MPRSAGSFLQGGASAAATGVGVAALASNPVGWAVGLGLGAASLYDNIFGKSDKEIRQERIREYLKRRAAMREKSLARLSEETGKNVGRINQYTTGTIKRTQGDLATRSASRGRDADEADFLAAQGVITGQGSEAIQQTQDASDRIRRQIEEQADQDAMNAESEGIFAPEDPNFTDVLGSIAPAALQYGMNQKMLGTGGTPSTPSASMNPNGTRFIQPTDIGSDIGFNMLPTNVSSRSPMNVRDLSVTPNFSVMDEDTQVGVAGDLVRTTRKPRIRNVYPDNFSNYQDPYYYPMRDWR